MYVLDKINKKGLYSFFEAASRTEAGLVVGQFHGRSLRLSLDMTTDFPELLSTKEKVMIEI